MTALRIRITGTVQGVYFRSEAQKKAQELSVRGWARNDADGSVIVHAEGADEAVQAMEQWCHTGSSAAKVETVESESTEVEKYQTFEILR